MVKRQSAGRDILFVRPGLARLQTAPRTPVFIARKTPHVTFETWVKNIIHSETSPKAVHPTRKGQWGTL